MTKFIETTAGFFVAASSVGQIYRVKDSDTSCKIRTTDGHDYTAYGSANEVVELLGSTYIPAAPGFALVIADVRDCSLEDFKRWPTPVIAWRFNCDSSHPTPVTLEGPQDGAQGRSLIVQPDGSVVDAGGLYWPSLDEAYADLVKRDA